MLKLGSNIKGFSLIEVLITISIGAIIGSLLMAIFVQSNDVFFLERIKVAQGVNINDAVNFITEDIKSATAVTDGYPPPTPSIFSTSSQIVLKLPALALNGDVISDEYDYIVIGPDAASPKILKETTYLSPNSKRPSKNRILTTQLSTIQFLYADQNGNSVSPSSASKIQFIINLSENLQSESKTSSASANVNLRNN